MRLALILGLAAGFASLPALAAGQKDPDAAGVQEAIRFEKAKQAAADRQARIEARGQEANTADRSGDRVESEDENRPSHFHWA